MRRFQHAPFATPCGHELVPFIGVQGGRVVPVRAGPLLSEQAIEFIVGPQLEDATLSIRIVLFGLALIAQLGNPAVSGRMKIRRNLRYDFPCVIEFHCHIECVRRRQRPDLLRLPLPEPVDPADGLEPPPQI